MSCLDASTKETLEKEILPFLNCSARPDLKSIALEHFLGMTGSEDGRKFIARGNGFLEAIVSLTSDSQPDIVKNAFYSLVNLTTDEDVSWYLLNMKEYPDLCVNFLKYILKCDSDHADILASILSNITRSHRCAVKVADVISGCSDNDGEISLEKMVQAFCSLDHNPKANLHFLATILMNLTQVPSVRHQIMDQKRLVLQRLLPFTEFADSKMRRAGIVGVLKNCCFETDFHGWLIGKTVDILPRLLLPLAGPEEFDDDDMDKLPDDLQYLPPDKQRESDPDIRKMLIEGVTQLCATKPCRLYIKEKNTYVIMRELHKWEKDKGCDVAISNLIDLLIADEPPEGMDNYKEVEIPEKLKATLDAEYAKTQEEIENCIKLEMEDATENS